MRYVQVRCALTRAISIAILAPLGAVAQEKSPAPVTIITVEQLRAEGLATVHDALSTLTEATGTVQADVAGGSNTVHANALNLRNLGPGRSLLLGERVEVLASGPSAIYRSDAVASVINVILKQDCEGNELTARGCSSTHDGRDTWTSPGETDAHPDSWRGQRRNFDFRVSSGIRLLDVSTGIRQAPSPA